MWLDIVQHVNFYKTATLQQQHSHDKQPSDLNLQNEKKINK